MSENGRFGIQPEAFLSTRCSAIWFSPFLRTGGDGLQPFLKDASRGVWVLCKTSNPGAEKNPPVVSSPSGESDMLYSHVPRLIVALVDAQSYWCNMEGLCQNPAIFRTHLYFTRASHRPCRHRAYHLSCTWQSGWWFGPFLIFSIELEFYHPNWLDSYLYIFFSRGRYTRLNQQSAVTFTTWIPRNRPLHCPKLGGSQDLQALQLPSGDPLCLAKKNPRNTGAVIDDNIW